MEQFDSTDQKILQILQHNARLNVKEIASTLNMPNTPIYDRIKRLEKNGVLWL